MKRNLALLCGFGFVGPLMAVSNDVSPALVADLQAAFNGESNARAQYLAFAQKADQEGYAGVASLFRAAARAEEIHAGNHATVIRKYGAEPSAKIATPAVRSTRENLGVAIKGETYERDQMYPRFIQQAKLDANTDAEETFRFALAAEAEHARLYAEALNDMEGMKTARTFYVCPVCGFTTPNGDFEECSTCANPKDYFEPVS